MTDESPPEKPNLFHTGLSDEIMEAVRDGFGRLMEKGFTEDEALRRIGEVIPDAIAEGSGGIVADLKRRGPTMVLEHGTIRQEFEARLFRRWQEPLVLYEMVFVASQEAGADFNDLYRAQAVRDKDAVFLALNLLHGRGCVTASEVYSLLRSGHAFGAQARWRTLHEIAVVSYLIASNGQGLAERYLLHAEIQTAKDAEDYQRYCEFLGEEPFTDSDMARFRSRKQELIGRFGKGFQTTYGWAAALLNKDKPTFRDLEEKAGMDHIRPNYGLASHRLHPGAKGAALNVLSRGPHSVIVAGPTNAGLANPGYGALVSLHQVTTYLLLFGRRNHEDDQPTRIMVIKAIEKLVDEAGEAFLRVHRQLEEEEEDLWSEDTDSDDE